MRVLEVRRHSHRVRPGQHLSQYGVHLARRLGKRLGPFHHVCTSPLPRCVETAVALGFAVDDTSPHLAGDDGRGEGFPGMTDVDWEAGYAGFAHLLARHEAFASFAARQAALWRAVIQALPEGASALLVGHGGGFLAGPAVFCLPHAEHRLWGAVPSYCEGVRLHVDGDTFTAVEILRVEPDM